MAGAMLLERIGRLGGAAAAGGGRDALSYGVSFATTRSHQLARGPALTSLIILYAREGQAVVCPLLRGSRQRDRSRQNSTGVSGVLSLYPLARGCRRIWRGELRFIGFGGATLLDRIGPAWAVPRRR